MFAHDGARQDALAVEHAAEPARPGGVDQCVGHRAAIERRDIAAEQDAVIGDDDADRRVELTETAQHPVLPRILFFTGDTHRAEQSLGHLDLARAVIVRDAVQTAELAAVGLAAADAVRFAFPGPPTAVPRAPPN